MEEKEYQYDGLMEIPEDQIEAHQKIYVSKIKDGKIYFPFRHLLMCKYGNYQEKCNIMIRHSDI
jgi:hypothetical protein